MPNDLSSTPVPESPPTSWLARNRKFAILGGILLILAVALGAALLNQPAGPGVTSTTSISQINNGSGRPTFQRYSATIIDDQDKDGLSDQEESQLGTDPKLADSDGDGLTDLEEVRVYQTDPKRQDTDGDGSSDAQEVASGQNPKGPGLLRDLTQAIQQLNQSE